MIYVRLKLNIGGSYIVPVKNLEIITDEIKEAVAEGNVDEKWEIDLLELTDEEYAELPDFEGH